eukprot:TRINITY_DN4721_c0_g3_i1.p1 TRINITY_DN4721_c0_g3~~TRINITY_DN4721_c0_g3_i1.p1  ORF type:complete len:645 (+),score=126.67 TRINITY_DN4721_c0_g3_i1:99-2033(+)
MVRARRMSKPFHARDEKSESESESEDDMPVTGFASRLKPRNKENVVSEERAAPVRIESKVKQALASKLHADTNVLSMKRQPGKRNAFDSDSDSDNDSSAAAPEPIDTRSPAMRNVMARKQSVATMSIGRRLSMDQHRVYREIVEQSMKEQPRRMSVRISGKPEGPYRRPSSAASVLSAATPAKSALRSTSPSASRFDSSALDLKDLAMPGASSLGVTASNADTQSVLSGVSLGAISAVTGASGRPMMRRSSTAMISAIKSLDTDRMSMIAETQSIMSTGSGGGGAQRKMSIFRAVLPTEPPELVRRESVVRKLNASISPEKYVEKTKAQFSPQKVRPAFNNTYRMKGVNSTAQPVEVQLVIKHLQQDYDETMALLQQKFREQAERITNKHDNMVEDLLRKAEHGRVMAPPQRPLSAQPFENLNLVESDDEERDLDDDRNDHVSGVSDDKSEVKALLSSFSGEGGTRKRAKRHATPMEKLRHLQRYLSDHDAEQKKLSQVSSLNHYDYRGSPLKPPTAATSNAHEELARAQQLTADKPLPKVVDRLRGPSPARSLVNAVTLPSDQPQTAATLASAVRRASLASGDSLSLPRRGSVDQGSRRGSADAAPAPSLQSTIASFAQATSHLNPSNRGSFSMTRRDSFSMR